MRFNLLLAALAFCLAPCAFAQSKPIYFLVDASGSMDGQNKKDAELYLSALSLPRSQPVSIVYFGKKPATPGTNLCFEKLDVREPVPRGDNFSPRLPELGGDDDQTAITNAIDEVLGKLDGKGPAKLIVVTDGEERCNAYFAEIWDRHSNAEIEIEVRQVGDTPNPELQKLEEGRPIEPVAAESSPLINFESNSQWSNSAENAWEAADWGERYFWLLPYTLLAVAGWFFGSSIGKKAQFYEAATIDLQNARRNAAEFFVKHDRKSDEPWPEPKTDDDATTDEVRKSTKKGFALVFLACASGLPLMLLSGAVDPFPLWAIWAVPVLTLVSLIAARNADPPPLKWSALRYVFGQDGGSGWQGSVTSRRRSSRSSGRLMCWSRRASRWSMRCGRSASRT